MARSLDAAIDALRARVAALVFAHAFLVAVGVTCLAAGALILVARVAVGADAVSAAWFVVPLVLALAWALARARDRRMSRAAAAAWLDVRAGGRGDVVDAFERGVGEAQALAATLRAPRPRARLARPLSLGACGLAFAALALLVPVPSAQVGPPIALQEAQLERAKEKLATLEEALAIDPEAASELRAELERLEVGEGLANASSALEAIDAAQSKLDARAESAAEALRAAAAELDAAQADPEAARAALERALAELSRAGLDGDVAKSVEAGAAGKLDSAQFAKLSGDLSSKLGEKLAKLAAAGLLKDGKLSRSAELAKIDPVKLREHVCDERCKLQPGGK